MIFKVFSSIADFFYFFRHVIFFVPFALAVYGYFSKKIKLSKWDFLFLLPSVATALLFVVIVPMLHAASPSACGSAAPGTCFGIAVIGAFLLVPLSLACNLIALILISKKLFFIKNEKNNKFLKIGLVFGLFAVFYFSEKGYHIYQLKKMVQDFGQHSPSSGDIAPPKKNRKNPADSRPQQ